jgi:pyridoxal phosphate enzyme (YggS family)
VTVADDAPDTLEARYRRVLSEIADAARSAGRLPDDITTVVVTKFQPVSLIRQLVALGHRDIGENRHQEAVAKHAELGDGDLVWHFVGQLQSNKAKAVAQYADVIHSIDRASLVTKLADQPRPIDIFLEINLTDDSGRGGVAPDDLMELVDQTLTHPHLTLRGLMAVAPQDVSPAEAFDKVVALRERVVVAAPHATDLSLGMSGDFAEAIAAGATHLRIGTAITGKRPQPV